MPDKHTIFGIEIIRDYNAAMTPTAQPETSKDDEVRRMLRTMEAYTCSWKTLVLNRGDEFFWFSPIYSLLSFSCEIGLKGIILWESDKKIKGHNLEKLFCQLTPDTQQAIKQQVGKDRPDIFDRALKYYANCFTEIRYVYEMEGFALEPWLSNFEESIIQHLKSLV